MNRPTNCLLVALAFLLTAVVAEAQSPITYNINYSANNLNMWGTGGGNNIVWTPSGGYLGPSWDVYGEVGEIEETWIGDFGARAWASSSGGLGLNVEFQSTGGSIDVQAPFKVTLTPGGSMGGNFNFAGNHTLNINSLVNLPAGQSIIRTTFPSAEFKVGGHLAASATVGGEFAFFDSWGGEATLFDFSTDFPILSYNVGGNNKLKLFDLLSKDVTNGVTLPIRTGIEGGNPFAVQVGTVTLNAPQLSATSGSAFSVTKSQETVLNVSTDLLGAMTVAAGLPINPFDVIVRVGPLDWEGRLLSARMGLSLGLEQEVTFDPQLHMVLRTSEAVTYHLASGDITTNALDLTNLNQLLSFTKHSDTPIDFIPEFYINPTINNTLNLPISGTFDAEALKMSIGRLGFDLFSLGPLWSYHQNMGQIGDPEIYNQNLDLSGVQPFLVHVIGQGLTDKAPTILQVPARQVYQAPGLTGTFSTTNIDGVLRLTDNAFYLNNAPLNVSGLLQIGQGSGAASRLQTPSLTTSGGGGILMLGETDNLTITNFNGWGDMSGTTLTRGNYEIYGQFFYNGSDIITNNANLIIGTTTNLSNSGHNALQSFAVNNGAFTMQNASLAVPNSFTNTGTLNLRNFSNLTTQGFANSGTVDLEYLAVLNTNGSGEGTNTFTSIDGAGTLGNGIYRIEGELQYSGPNIETSNADITLIGQKSGYYFTNGFNDGLRRLSTNNNRLSLIAGARQTIDPVFGTNFVNNSTISAKEQSELTIQGRVVNNGTMRSDGQNTLIRIASDEDNDQYTLLNNGTVELANSGRIGVAGRLGNFTNVDTDNHTAYLAGGTWNLGNGMLSYGQSSDAEFIKQINAGTTIRINGGSFYNQARNGNGLSRLQTNHGYLEHGGDLNTLLSQNTGTLIITSGTFGTSTSLNNTGSITVKPQATFGNSSQTWSNVDSNGALSGIGNFELAGTLRYVGSSDIKALSSGVNLTLSGSGRIERSGSNALLQFGEIRSGAQLHLTNGYTFNTNSNSPFTVKAGGAFSTDLTSVLQVVSGTTAVFEAGASITNNGGIFLNAVADAPAGTATRLTINGAGVTLSGGGVIGLSNHAGNLIDGNGWFLNVNNLIGGVGTISAAFINRGTIESVGSAGLTISASNFTNSGRVHSYGGLFYADLAPSDPSVYIPDLAHPQILYSPMTINNSVVTNYEGSTAGLIESSSSITLNNAQILGGNVKINNAAGVVMNNSRITSAVEVLAGGTLLVNGGTEQVEGMLNNRAGGTIQLSTNRALQFGAGLNNQGMLKLGENTYIQHIAGQSGSFTNSGTIQMRSLDGAAFIQTPLRNLATGTIEIGNSGGIVLSGGTFENAGNVGISVDGSGGGLGFNGSVNITGGGTIQLGGIRETSPGVYLWSSGASLWASSGSIITNVDNTILGTGPLGINWAGLINSGTIRAQGGLLVLHGNSITNTGTLETNGQFLSVNGPFQSISGGVLQPGTYRMENGVIQLQQNTFTSNAANIILSGTNAYFRGPGGVDLISDHLAGNSGSLAIRAGKVQTIGRTLTNTGAITIGGSGDQAGGTLGVNGLAGNGSVNLADNSSALILNNSIDEPVYSGLIAGAGSLTKNGSYTQWLTGTNSYSGGTQINGGVLAGPGGSIQGNIINHGQVRFEQSAAGAYNGNISGTGSVVINGNGHTLGLTGNNTYEGGTTVNSGTLEVGSAALPSGGALTMNGGTLKLTFNQTIGRLRGQAGSVINLGANALTIYQNGETVRFEGALTGEGGSLHKQGGWTLGLSSASSYSGHTRLYDGVLAVGNDAALGTSTLHFQGGGIVPYNDEFHTIANPVVMENNGFIDAGTGSLTFSGNWSLPDSRTLDVRSSGVTKISGAIGQTGGASSFTKTGSGKLILTGQNTYTGGTFVHGGTLELDCSNGTVLPSGSSITVSNASLRLAGTSAIHFSPLNITDGILDAAGSSNNHHSLGALSLYQSVITGSNPDPVHGNFVLEGDVTTSGFYASTIEAPVIQLDGARTFNVADNSVGVDLYVYSEVNDVAGGTGSLIKTGAGTLLLNNSNHYTGGTTINAGTIQLGGASLADSAPVTINGGTLRLGGADERIGILTGGTSAHIDLGSRNLTADMNTWYGAYQGTISGNGGFVKTGPYALELTGNNSFSGGLHLQDGVLVAGHSSAFGTGALHLKGGGLYSYSPRTLGNAVELKANSYIQGGSLPLDFTGNWTLHGSYQLDVPSNAGTATIWGDIVETGGSRSFTKTGGGKLVMAGHNNYTGGTTVAQGTLELDGSNGTVFSGSSITINENAAVRLAGTNYNAVSNIAITLKAGATLEAAGSSKNSHTLGRVTLQGGSITGSNPDPVHGNFVFADDVDASGVIPSTINAPVIQMSGTRNFNIESGSALTISSQIADVAAGSGGITKNGSGTLSLTGANTYSGGTIITGGTFVASNNNAVGTGTVRVTAGTFHITGGVSVANAIELSGGQVVRDLSGNLAGAIHAISDLPGGVDTTVSLLAGNASSSIQLRTHFTQLSLATNDDLRISDVFDITGTGTTSFVLQLSIPSSIADAGLGWMNNGIWTNAVDGNTGNNATAAQQHFKGSFAAFQSLHGTDLSQYMGAFGTDAAANSTWAVLNHNSEYAVITGVPEPTVVALMLFAAAPLLFRRRPRK